MSFFSKKQNKNPENLEEVLAQFKKLKEDFSAIEKEMAGLKKEARLNLKKVGIIRFNPFSEVGGNQSFSAAIMNENNDGVVITSLFTRSENRVYGKPIKNGSSEFTLSEEEKKAIEMARNGENREVKSTDSK